MPSASAGIGSRKNICHKTQTAGQALRPSRCFSVWILKVFSLSMAGQPLSCCLKILIVNRALILSDCYPHISPHDSNFVAVFVNVRAVFTMIGALVFHPAEARYIDFVTGLQFFRRLGRSWLWCGILSGCLLCGRRELGICGCFNRPYLRFRLLFLRRFLLHNLSFHLCQ